MDLLAWAKENGTEVGAVTIQSSPESGLLLLATEDIPPCSNIVSCSYKTILSYLNIALPSTSKNTTESFPAEFIQALQISDPNILGHFFLIQQYLMRDKSFWYPYIKLLPQPNKPEKLGIPILWSHEDQKFLAGTNAEPPIKQQAQMWKSDWKTAIALLPDQDQREKYKYELYQWAAYIFGSRSFRASLTVPEDQIRNSGIPEEDKIRLLEHIRLDRFSVLLPLLDLGNHNGVNEVNWSQEPTKNAFMLSNHNFIPKGSQVYNYYGNKSNSELLVAYGFTLPDSQHDIVNLKVTPGPVALTIRRCQACHHTPELDQLGIEFMFQVHLSSSHSGKSKVPELRPFSHGLIDTIACMVATSREAKCFSSNGRTCLETSITESLGPLPRNLIQVLYILQAKLESEIERIDTHGSSLGPPKTKNQILALDYRTRQRQTLLAALTPIYLLLSSLLTFTFPNPLPISNTRPSVLSLEHAYAYLSTSYPEVGTAVLQIIAADQEEQLPLNWAVLVEDWDHTYWIVWVFLFIALYDDGDEEDKGGDKKDAVAEQQVRPVSWLNVIEFDDRTTSKLHAERSEEETIDSTIESILPILMSKGVDNTWTRSQNVKELRNYASYIVREESIRGSYKTIPQELLCISFPSFSCTLP